MLEYFILLFSIELLVSDVVLEGNIAWDHNTRKFDFGDEKPLVVHRGFTLKRPFKPDSDNFDIVLRTGLSPKEYNKSLVIMVS